MLTMNIPAEGQVTDWNSRILSSFRCLVHSQDKAITKYFLPYNEIYIPATWITNGTLVEFEPLTDYCSRQNSSRLCQSVSTTNMQCYWCRTANICSNKHDMYTAFWHEKNCHIHPNDQFEEITELSNQKEISENTTKAITEQNHSGESVQNDYNVTTVESIVNNEIPKNKTEVSIDQDHSSESVQKDQYVKTVESIVKNEIPKNKTEVKIKQNHSDESVQNNQNVETSQLFSANTVDINNEQYQRNIYIIVPTMFSLSVLCIFCIVGILIYNRKLNKQNK
ncbi:unnamed protein product [Schistosoma turkestanicum]|nr:unnamed protein product [Schistosoma turkestanicum]